MTDSVERHFSLQAGWCRALGSPFTSKIVTALGQLIESDNRVMRAVAAWPGDPTADALALRLAGALHALVLSGVDDEIAAVYPPNRPPGDEELRKVLAATLTRHEKYCLDWLNRPPQTNEVARSSFLLLAYADIYRRTGLPLIIREIGASAGLNLNFDRFGYLFGNTKWGLMHSPVMLAPEWEGPEPNLPEQIPVADRAGADTDPLDLSNIRHRLALTAYCWADQSARLARLSGAINIAVQARTRVEKISADAFVEREFAEPRHGVALTLSHTIVWQYLSPQVQNAITMQMSHVAAAATKTAPVAHVSFEPGADGRPILKTRVWPDGQEKIVAEGDAHGRRIFLRSQI